MTLARSLAAVLVSAGALLVAVPALTPGESPFAAVLRWIGALGLTTALIATDVPVGNTLLILPSTRSRLVTVDCSFMADIAGDNDISGRRRRHCQ